MWGLVTTTKFPRESTNMVSKKLLQGSVVFGRRIRGGAVPGIDLPGAKLGAEQPVGPRTLNGSLRRHSASPPTRRTPHTEWQHHSGRPLGVGGRQRESPLLSPHRGTRSKSGRSKSGSSELLPHRGTRSKSGARRAVLQNTNAASPFSIRF